jgi:cell division ATPase FtsA
MFGSDEIIEVRVSGGRGPRTLPTAVSWREILEPRLEEIFFTIQNELIRSRV